MKKPFSRRAPNRVLQNPFALGLGAAVLGLALLLALLRVAAPGALVALMTPFWEFGSAGTHLVASLGAYQSGLDTLVAERDRLEQENQSLASENQVLRAQLEDIGHLASASSTLPSGVLAGVLVRPPVAPYDTLVVEVNGADIAVGALAYGPGGVPLGTVEGVTQHSARIVLFSAPGKTTEGWAGASRTPITLNGLGAGAFSVTLPKGSPIAVGDAVYVSGPGALPIGTVMRVDTDPSSPQVSLKIRGSINPFSITWVRISPR